jgi:hypothetical protein
VALDMLYRVTGTNRDTNGAMVLDIEAVDRAGAALAAQSRGMAVAGVEDITAAAASRPTSVHRGEGPADGATPDSGGTRNLIVFTALLLTLALIGYFALPMLLQRNVVSPPVTTQPVNAD